MKAKKEFTEHEREIYRTGVLNGEAVTEARHRRIIIQNRKLRAINRVLVDNIKNLQSYDDAMKELVRAELGQMSRVEKFARISD